MRISAKYAENNYKTMKKILLLSITLLLICSFTSAKKVKQPKVPIKHQAEQVILPGFHNLYKVDKGIFRSEQPASEGFVALEELGIHTVLCLREHHDDRDEAKDTKLVLVLIPLDAAKITTEEISNSLRAIQQAKKPVLVHCWHGSDRTGCVIAAYRIVFQGWTKDEAIAELMYKPYGHNWREFPNIVEVLRSLDVVKMRKELGVK
jgi:tyrosine-protein phosphatase SIW14